MNLLKPLLIGTSTLFLTACCTCFPHSHTYDKDIVFVQNKPYLIPHGAEFTNIPVTNDITVKDYLLAGVDCKKGYITWNSPKVVRELKEIYRIDGADSFSYAYQMAIRDRKMGCSKPLSHSEYEYYRAQYGL